MNRAPGTLENPISLDPEAWDSRECEKSVGNRGVMVSGTNPVVYVETIRWGRRARPHK